MPRTRSHGWEDSYYIFSVWTTNFPLSFSLFFVEQTSGSFLVGINLDHSRASTSAQSPGQSLLDPRLVKPDRQIKHMSSLLHGIFDRHVRQFLPDPFYHLIRPLLDDLAPKR